MQRQFEKYKIIMRFIYVNSLFNGSEKIVFTRNFKFFILFVVNKHTPWGSMGLNNAKPKLKKFQIKKASY